MIFIYRLSERSLVDLDQELARCLSAFQINVGLGGILEGVDVVDVDLEFLRDDKVKELGRVPFKVCSFRDVAVDNGSHELDVFGTELQDVDRGDSSRLVRRFIVSSSLSHCLIVFHSFLSVLFCVSAME